MSEFRKDPIIDRWVIFASGRSNRPVSYQNSVLPVSKQRCPFCPGHEEDTVTEIWRVDSGDCGWSIRVVPNRYPAVSAEVSSSGESSEIFRYLSGVGIHDVIVETPEHDLTMQHYKAEKMYEVVSVYKKRIREIRLDDKLKYVIIFKNQGFNAGATISHSHTQLIALPVIPLNMTDELLASKRYYTEQRTCIYCQLIKDEQNQRQRVITENDMYISVAAYAARFPYEVWIIPKTHEAQFENTENNSLSFLAKIFSETLRRLDRVIDSLSYNFVLHSSPFRENAEKYYHWHIEIIPRTTNIAGFEWGTGYYINSVAPEQAAHTLKNISLS